MKGFIKQAAPAHKKLQARTVRYMHGATKLELCIAAGYGQKVLRRAIMAAQAMGYTAPE